MYNTAKDHFKQAKLKALNNHFCRSMEEEIKRVKQKRKQTKLKKKSKK